MISIIMVLRMSIGIHELILKYKNINIIIIRICDMRINNNYLRMNYTRICELILILEYRSLILNIKY